jgi:DNA gyrase inhibitor GyrI
MLKPYLGSHTRTVSDGFPLPVLQPTAVTLPPWAMHYLQPRSKADTAIAHSDTDPQATPPVQCRPDTGFGIPLRVDRCS